MPDTNDNPEEIFDRRLFFYRVSSITPMLVMGGVLANTGLIPLAVAEVTKKESEEGSGEVTPAEDLMREHGILKRVILIYREFLRRMDTADESAYEATVSAAHIIRTFIEDYHEKLEEDYLFPRFQHAGKLVDLTNTLKTQHHAGRKVTDIILGATKTSFTGSTTTRAAVTKAISQFIRMYEPHEAREDTVLFPAIHQIVLPDEYKKLGDQFEDKEHELFGENGFEKMVDRVAEIEKSLLIYDLSQFTPE